MAKKGLTKGAVLNAAAQLIEENGFENFSLRELASRLEIQPASVYNHAKNAGELLTGVGRIVEQELYELICEKAEGASVKEKLMSAAVEYRSYAKEHPELFKAISALTDSADGTEIGEMKTPSAAVISLIDNRLTDKTKLLHFVRAYIGAIRGFVTCELLGCFSEEETDDSYRFLVSCITDSVSFTDGENNLNGKFRKFFTRK